MTRKSYGHIFAFHAWFSFSNTSRFLERFRNINSINELVGETIKNSTGVPTSGGDVIYTYTFDYNVGVDQNGDLTSTMTVLVRPTGTYQGDVVTAFPGR